MEVSEFFGGAGLALDTSAARPEEQEEADERRERERELHSELDRGLKGIMDEDDDGDDSDDEAGCDSRFGDFDANLRLMYEMRVGEVQKLSEKLEECRREAASKEDQLFARLSIANSEKEQAERMLQQSQESLAAGEHRIIELEHKVSSLMTKLELFQSKNEELINEVAAGNASLIDAQNRLQAFKVSNGNNLNMDAMFKAQQERYEEETDRLERELSRTRNKLLEKENELLAFEKRHIDMERSKENLLVEKGSTINKLALELEETQNRLANNDTMKLNDKIMQLTSERNSYKHQVKELAGKLEATAKELVDTRRSCSKLNFELKQLESTLDQVAESRESDSFSELGRSDLINSNSDKIILLKQELSKSIRAQRLKREQIDKLNTILQKKDEMITLSKENEEKLIKEIEMLKEVTNISETKLIKPHLEMDRQSDNEQLQSQLKEAITEVNTLKTKCEELERGMKETEKIKDDSEDDVLYSNLQKDFNKVSYQLQDANKQIDDFKNMYIEVCVVKEKLAKEVDELKSSNIYKTLEEEQGNAAELLHQLKIEKLKVDELGKKLLDQQLGGFYKQLSNLKKDGLKSNEDSIEEFKINIELLEKENSKLKQMCQEQSDNISLMTSELQKSKKLILDLNAEIELQQNREALISQLKDKAKQFEQYITDQKSKAANKKSVHTLTDQNEDQINIIDPQHMLAVEDEIRQDMASRFALETKNLEVQYGKKVMFVKRELESHIEEMGELLKAKTREVETLQEVILLERQNNDSPKIQSPIDKEALHNDCKRQLRQCNDYIDKLKVEVAKSGEMNNKLSESTEELEKVRDKYKLIKKTAVRYKEYIIEKDKHVNSEIERIKQHYKESLKKMQDRLDAYIKETDRLVSKKMHSKG